MRRRRQEQGAPSAATLETLRRYAERRRDSAQALTDALRRKNPRRIREAIDAARQAAAQGTSPRPSSPGSGDGRGGLSPNGLLP